MRVCAHICLCVYACTRAFLFVCTCGCVCARALTCLGVCVYSCMPSVCTCVRVCARSHMSLCMRSHMSLVCMHVLVHACVSVRVCACACVGSHPRLSPWNTGPPLMLAALTGDVAQCTLYPPSSGYLVLSGYWFWYIISLDVICFVTFFSLSSCSAPLLYYKLLCVFISWFRAGLLVN